MVNRASVVLVKGAGDIGSAVAWTLHRTGALVVIVEAAAPATTRRRMAFADAVFDGRAELDAVAAVRVADAAAARIELARGLVPVLIGSAGDAARTLQPAVVVDARMRKRVEPEPQLTEAPLVIGLGPGFHIGRHCHVAIETAHGERLGAVLTVGAAAAYDGLPREIGGTRRERHVRAYLAGVFQSAREIGEDISAGDAIGSIAGVEHRAAITGVLRGLVRPGVAVDIGTRLAEIVPAGSGAPIAGVGERPRRIAEGVGRAIVERG